MADNKEIMVSVFMMTYNHENYIAQALDSILMQKINFGYEIIVGEDCSTDRTREIILSYAQRKPDLFKLILHNHNVGATANQNAVLKACMGKYIAICEGDDYWTDPYKLQKQVDFLEANPDYGLIHSDFDKFFTGTSQIVKAYNKTKKRTIPNGHIYNELFVGSYIATLTVCVRTALIREAREFLKSANIVVGDRALWMYVAAKSRIQYMNESTAVYRVNIESASHSLDAQKVINFYIASFDVRFWFIDNLNYNKAVKQELIKNYNVGLLKLAAHYRIQKYAKEAYKNLLKIDEKNIFLYSLCKLASKNPIANSFYRLAKSFYHILNNRTK